MHFKRYGSVEAPAVPLPQRSINEISGGSTESDLAVLDTANGVLSLVDIQLQRVKPIAVTDLLGSWYNEGVSQSDISMYILGFCSSSITTRTLAFSEDGCYVVQHNSESSSFTNFEDIYSGANSSASVPLSIPFS